MRTLLLLALLAILPTAAASLPLETPGHDADGDGNLDEGPVCAWGWDSGCVLRAYECFQPHRPGFGIACP